MPADQATLRVLTPDRTIRALAIVPKPAGCTNQCGMVADCDHCKTQNAKRAALGYGPAQITPGPPRLRHAA